MDQDAVIARLVNEFRYPPQGARPVAAKLAALSPVVAAAFDQWWSTGMLPQIEVEGYTPQELINNYRMNPIAAILTLDWLQREPKRALASLRKGHDDVRERNGSSRIGPYE